MNICGKQDFGFRIKLVPAISCGLLLAAPRAKVHWSEKGWVKRPTLMLPFVSEAPGWGGESIVTVPNSRRSLSFFLCCHENRKWVYLTSPYHRGWRNVSRAQAAFLQGSVTAQEFATRLFAECCDVRLSKSIDCSSLRAKYQVVLAHGLSCIPARLVIYFILIAGLRRGQPVENCVK